MTKGSDPIGTPQREVPSLLAGSTAGVPKGSDPIGTVVVVGDVAVDVVARAGVPFARGTDAAARIAFRPGGSGQNVAAWLAEAGARVALVCRLGYDPTGDEALARLRAAGVDVRAARDVERATGVCVVVVEPDGERSFLPDRGANAALAASDLPEALLREAAHLHVSGYAFHDDGPGRALLERAAAAGVSSSVDPASAGPLARQGAAAFLAAAASAGLLLPNGAEARALTGLDDAAAAARALAVAREVVVTLGADGAIWSDGERTVHRPALAPERVLDTTGAGDAFTAGFLAARARGAEPADALDGARALAARAVARVGAGPPHRERPPAATRDRGQPPASGSRS